MSGPFDNTNCAHIGGTGSADQQSAEAIQSEYIVILRRNTCVARIS